jgi:uncharacterized SAM-binding protein YcdF (DUF218 family)
VPSAICVLGCRTTSPALARRIEAAAQAFREGRGALVVACGGRAWGEGLGEIEADAMAARLVHAGVPGEVITRERCSFDTRDNARFAAALLARRGIGRVLVVTCAWHLPRATTLFRAAGLDASGLGVPRPGTTPLAAAWLTAREALAAWKDARRPVRIG